MKSILLYFALLGVSVAGAFGIVRLGRNLPAPISVGGVWNVEPGPQSAEALRCSNFGSNPLVLTISQSGSRLVVDFDDPKKTKLAGEIHDEIIVARSQAGRTESEPASALQLQAKVNRQPGLHLLEGVLTVSKCPPETQLTFKAIRERKPDYAGQGR